MENTNLNREALISGIESFAACIESVAVLRRVWKILYREYDTHGGISISSAQDRNALRFYARHLSPAELEAVLRYIHSIIHV